MCFSEFDESKNLDPVIQSLLACSQNIFPPGKSLQTSDKRLEGAKHPCSKPGGHMFSTLGIILTLSLISYSTFDNAGTTSVLD